MARLLPGLDGIARQELPFEEGPRRRRFDEIQFELSLGVRRKRKQADAEHSDKRRA